MKGRIHSLESFGTVDGPGIRYVVFFQGCPMRCLYCHNPDTWNLDAGTLMESDEILEAIWRNQTFYTSGGITATGGEPLMQLEFLTELFTKAKKLGIHTCLDTSGILFSKTDSKKLEQFDRLSSVTDLVLLDIKHIQPEEHKKLTSHSNQNVLDFARYLDEKQIPIWIRHVVVPGITFNETSLKTLGAFLSTLHNVKAIEILPYHTMGCVKYEKLGLEYPLKDTPQLTKAEAQKAEEILVESIRQNTGKAFISDFGL